VTPRVKRPLPRALARTIALRGPIVLRASTPADGTALAGLAELADRDVPPAPLLVAEVLGQVLAVRGADGQVLADPFRATADLLDLLEVRARQLEIAAA
jgi:hypothetical protein